MKAIHLFVAVIALATLSSCGQGRNNDESAANSEIDQLENELKNIDPKAKGDNTCLLGYAEKYEELLTKDMVAEATGSNAGQMTMHENKIHKDTKYHYTKYSWKTGKTKERYGMDLPEEHGVSISGIEAISLNQFQMSYKAVSKAAAAALTQKANEALDGKSDNAAVNEGMKKLDEMGISKEEQKKMMEGFANTAQKMTEGFTKVDNLGQAATWNAKTNTLYVFENGAMFELVVELSDSGRNLEVATTIATQILNKCK
ncbi:hypothetical protein FAZ15_03595 [Sphingobacterium olei]|uniref:Uncharacterized protein n=1 Tax=Sphingobacterium olei TaxID=2571155 RepID=A0A4U0P7B7_9SPHI|nr:hypothetical protein [Sphingobacterium olei]TJZ63376.1 hypothetical protein FAZ15_03595 [Sphingobacterium olei]